jgi:arylsulfatase A-like enzyme
MKSVCFAVLLVAAAIAVGPDAFGAERPNIIFILADDLGFGDVGFNGQKKIKTPELDRLSREGMRLNSFYAGSPVCGPSRATLMSGKHTGHCKIRGNPRWTKSGKPVDFATTDETLGKVMKSAGYACGYFGKWALNENVDVGSAHPNKHGFDEFWGFNTHIEAHYHWPDYVWHNDKKVDLGGPSNWAEKKVYADDLFTEKAIDFINTQTGEQPFFVFLGYTIPHRGISAPEASWKQYEGQGWPSKKGKRGHYRDDPDTHISYAAMVSHMDSYIGQIRAALDQRGILKETLILFTSDNGHEYDTGFFDSNGIYTGKKRWLHEGGIRMPSVAFWPEAIKANTQLDTPFAFWDIMATFSELAGGNAPTGDGISFLPSLTGKGTQPEHDYLYWEFNEKKGPMQALRFGGTWKAYREWKGDGMGAIQIFDLENDPSETKNQAASQPDMVAKAEALFEQARTPHSEFPLVRKVRAK